MYQRILVPLDGSDLALTALRDALELCNPLNASLVLLHVYDPRSGSAVAGQRHLEFVREMRVPEHQPVELVVRKGPIAPTIIATAKKLKIDLIVMATHGRSGVRRVVYGSVAEQILRGSTIATLLVRVPNAEQTAPVSSVPPHIQPLPAE